jgi:hypothetical protein
MDGGPPVEGSRTPLYRAGRDGEPVSASTRFAVARSFLARYEVQTAGGEAHREYWIPAEHLAEFNANIRGRIEVIARFEAPQTKTR